ncbi:ChaN family lipoprotein [Agarivorans sp. 1_MG-2023]|uniref:ChaN family lipoprotein n=1 Tax=Agarivorans sp. 1_MG-2023 TaxID=3062634 RepID=UPI0026E38D17|nr:ChaN family lipoprotein [Agarivorans sp. 1_MG-2023]MDO6763028.1 ChaN family lipoprotein [Agarivorans sp. 1_MG-2023]
MLFRLSSFLFILVSLAACSAGQPNTGLQQASTAAPLETYYDYILFDPHAQQVLTDTETLASLLADSNVVLFGEYHSHPGIHLAQLRLFQSLHAQHDQLSLSMEQFDRSQQALVNEYLNDDIGEEWLIKQTNAWPNYRSDYRPLVEFSKAKHLNVIAANAPKAHVTCIGSEGLAYLHTLDSEQRLLLSQEFTVDDPAYQQRLFGNAHHGDSQQSQNHFLAMLAWDETMAESIAAHLNNEANQQVMHIVGNFHIEQKQGTYSRVQQRLPNSKISSVVAVSQQDFLALSIEEQQAKGDYLIVVLNLPKRYQNADNRKAEYQHIKQRSNKQCKSIN